MRRQCRRPRPCADPGRLAVHGRAAAGQPVDGLKRVSAVGDSIRGLPAGRSRNMAYSRSMGLGALTRWGYPLHAREQSARLITARAYPALCAAVSCGISAIAAAHVVVISCPCWARTAG
jgi:hypothetical protein